MAEISERIWRFIQLRNPEVYDALRKRFETRSSQKPLFAVFIAGKWEITETTNPGHYLMLTSRPLDDGWVVSTQAPFERFSNPYYFMRMLTVYAEHVIFTDYHRLRFTFDKSSGRIFSVEIEEDVYHFHIAIDSEWHEIRLLPLLRWQMRRWASKRFTRDALGLAIYPPQLALEATAFL